MSITFLKLFTFVGDAGQTFHTDWVPAPSDRKTGQLVVDVKSRIGASSIGVQLEGSMDGDGLLNISAAVNTGASGVTTTPVTTGVFPMVRLTLTANVASQVTVSVSLLPQMS